MEFPLIIQAALPQVLPLLPGFGASLAVGVWLLQPRKWRAAAGVRFAVYLRGEFLWQQGTGGVRPGKGAQL